MSSSQSLLEPVSDAHAVAALEARSAQRRRRADWASWVDRAVLLGLTAAGLLSADGPAPFYAALGLAFGGLAGGVLGGAALVTLLGERSGRRLQGPRRGSARRLAGARDTAIAMWVAAALLAWPLARVLVGKPIGLVWTVPDVGTALRLSAQTVASLFVLDAWLYWKHRLLHTRWLFPLHRAHHAYRDPNGFSSFAVGPVEALATFWPIVLLAVPEATHWAPLYFPLVVAFIALNLYLHCGVSVRALEAILPKLLLNTSVFHNRHHANAAASFSEAFTVWDRICRTREQDRR
ncbi:MAG: sterol desaturase family protein [Polyangiaceae bacterium]|nr:sterol desaturase family protein [Polyangiaceae bacterium]